MLIDDRIIDNLLIGGSKFIGFQKSRGSSYEVEVTILSLKHKILKLNRNYFEKFLQMSGLGGDEHTTSAEHPPMTRPRELQSLQVVLTDPCSESLVQSNHIFEINENHLDQITKNTSSNDHTYLDESSNIINKCHSKNNLSFDPGKLSQSEDHYDKNYDFYESLIKRWKELFDEFWCNNSPYYLSHFDTYSINHLHDGHIDERNETYLIWNHILSGGSIFKGRQSPMGKCHEVSVTIQDCDFSNDYCCGYLTIKGLTFDYPILTTFFEGEIIGPKYDFLTKKWQATFDTDMKHWSKFKEFEKYKDLFSNGTLNMEDVDRSDCLFMRWKEKFLVPCHQINSIPGASFAGFYYICLRRSQPSIFGFYYHQTSEWFQSLELAYINTRTSGSYKFL